MASGGLNKFEVIGAKEIQEKMLSITPKQMRRAHINAIKASGKLIENEAKRIVSSELPNIPKKPRYSQSQVRYYDLINRPIKKKKWSPSQKEIVTYAGETQDGTDYYSKTTAMPKRQLKWFATGTKPHSVKKHLVKYRDSMMNLSAFDTAGQTAKAGGIKGIHFMERAKQVKGDEAIKNLDDNLNKAIQYQWIKKH